MAVSKREDARIGVGIIGIGAQANLFVPACKANPHAEIVGLSEVREGVAESFAQAHDIAVPVFSDYRDLLALDGLDAVIIITPNNVHAPMSIAAAEAGKHILCEKPMATTLADAEAMAAAVEKADVRGMVGYTLPFYRATRFLHDLLQSEDLGRVYHIRAFRLQGWLSDPAAPMRWRLNREMAGTGALGDLASHAIALAQFLVPDDITRVTGMMTTFVTERLSATDPQKKETVDVDDAVMFCAEFKNGALGVFQATRNATGRPDHWRIEIDAEKGAVILDSLDPRVLLNLPQGPARYAGWVELQIPRQYRVPSQYGVGAQGLYAEAMAAQQNQIDHFVECIRSGQTPAPSFADGLKIERVMDAVVRSGQTGAAVDV